MAKVEIYHATYCPFCHKALALLKSKGVDFTEYDVTDDQEGRAKLLERANGSRTVPQIFIDDKHIGGFDDVNALDQKGELDALLSA